MDEECDGYFFAHNIPFEDAYQDEAIHTVRSDPDLTLPEKKWLILCWFDQTYGIWNGSRFDLKDSRVKMSQWLTQHNYASYEQLLKAT